MSNLHPIYPISSPSQNDAVAGELAFRWVFELHHLKFGAVELTQAEAFPDLILVYVETGLQMISFFNFGHPAFRMG